LGLLCLYQELFKKNIFLYILRWGCYKMAWLYLAAAIGAEIIATTLLKFSQGFRELGYGAGSIGLYSLAFYCLAQAILAIPIGIAYALWSGVGTVAIALIGGVFWGQALSLLQWVYIGLIVGGVVGLNLSMQGH
jgi:small multidrug resistance pump